MRDCFAAPATTLAVLGTAFGLSSSELGELGAFTAAMGLAAPSAAACVQGQLALGSFVQAASHQGGALPGMAVDSC